MNKQELISKRISANNEKFGRWHSDKVVGRACKIKILNEAPPKNELEALQHCNSLADTGNYPVGADECFNVGISGGCGLDCFVYLKGECGEPMLSPRGE